MATNIFTPIDEPTCVADTESPATGQVLPLTGILGTLIPPEVAKDKKATVKWIWRAISDPERACDSASVDRRLSLIGHLEDLMRTGFSCTADLRQKVERFLDGHDGRRLPVGKAIKRARKDARLSQVGLAELLGLKDHTLISKYESGKRVPPLKVMEWLKEAEDVTRSRRVKGNGRIPRIAVTSTRGNEAPIPPDLGMSRTSPNPQRYNSVVNPPSPAVMPAQGGVTAVSDLGGSAEDTVVIDTPRAERSQLDLGKDESHE